MTAQEKLVLASFLDITLDYLDSGYAKKREAWVFEDDSALPSEEPSVLLLEEPAALLPSLPLAYQIAEEDFAVLPEEEDSIGSLCEEINACSACTLAKTRTRAVPGEGSEPLVLIIGEGPGAEEDASGRPFVGRAGQLLDRMLASIGLSREKNCYIVNIVKCRPPHNRDPEEDEIRACTGYLERQIRLLKPKLILCAGRVSARYILKSEEGLERLREKIKLRGGFGEYTVSNSSPDFSEEEDDEANRGSTEMFHSADELNAHFLPIPVLATYHPSALLHDESLKRPVFEDMKLLMTRLVDLDRNYAGDVKELLRKYAATDDDFANRVQEYLA